MRLRVVVHVFRRVSVCLCLCVVVCACACVCAFVSVVRFFFGLKKSCLFAV